MLEHTRKKTPVTMDTKVLVDEYKIVQKMPKIYTKLRAMVKNVTCIHVFTKCCLANHPKEKEGFHTSVSWDVMQVHHIIFWQTLCK